MVIVFFCMKCYGEDFFLGKYDIDFVDYIKKKLCNVRFVVNRYILIVGVMGIVEYKNCFL